MHLLLWYHLIFRRIVFFFQSRVSYRRVQKKKKQTEQVKRRGSWTDKHKKIMLKFFANHIKNKISPKKHECLELKKENSDLFGDKNWVQIKVFIYNTYNKKN